MSIPESPIPQAAALPYRRRGGRLEICLITATRSRRWSIPKGVIEPGETAVDTALKEAQEEAGLEGRIECEPIGSYEYRKWGKTLTVTVYLMEVSGEVEVWAEQHLRDRRWVEPARAVELLADHPAAALLQPAVTLLDRPAPRS